MNPSADLKWLVEHPEATMMSEYHDAGSCWKLIDEARKEILRLRDSRWIQLSERFRKLGDKTGMDKLSSYTVGISIGGDGAIYVEVGGYDVPGWPRHKEIGTFTSEKDALAAFEAAVIEAEKLVKDQDADDRKDDERVQDLQDRQDDEDGVGRTLSSLGFIGDE